MSVMIFIFKAFIHMYGGICALLLYFYCLVVHASTFIYFGGEEKIKKLPAFILACWHSNVVVYGVLFPFHKRKHVWMIHPVPYMLPIHYLSRLIGIKKIVYGSSGHSGKKASVEMVEYLKKGYSTMIHPDGPSGPVYTLRKGILFISLQSGIPIVPMTIKAKRVLVIKKAWDKKIIPLPFSSLKVDFKEPIQVTKENFDEAAINLTNSLSF